MDDSRWLRAIRDGEAGAFEALYRAHRTPVYRYACSLTGSRDTAEDILQETFLGLLRNLGRIDDSRPLLPYLLRAARHRHVDRLRSTPRGVRSLDDVALDIAARPWSDDPEQTEDLARIAAALEQLPVEQAEAVRLKIYGEMSYEEIGEETGVPPATARTRYRAALDKLRAVLGKELRDAREP